MSPVLAAAIPEQRLDADTAVLSSADLSFLQLVAEQAAHASDDSCTEAESVFEKPRRACVT